MFGFYISYSGKLFFLKLPHGIEWLIVYTRQPWIIGMQRLGSGRRIAFRFAIRPVTEDI